VGNEAEESEEGSLSYDDAKEICLSSLVLVMQSRGGDMVPAFVGRSDIYILNKHGGLKQKNRRHGGADFYADGNGAPYCWGSTTCTTTTIKIDLNSLNFAASCA
jgi:hypothetical protein